MRLWNLVLFIAIAMMAISSVAEGQTQNLEGGQGVKWVPDEGQVPENAIRVRVGAGFPLCRGTLTEERGGQNWWRDIGVVKQDGKCHTLRAMKELRFQDDFYYLVRADTEGEVSTEGMVSEADVEARIAEATAQRDQRHQRHMIERRADMERRQQAINDEYEAQIAQLERELEHESYKRRVLMEEVASNARDFSLSEVNDAIRLVMSTGGGDRQGTTNKLMKLLINMRSCDGNGNASYYSAQCDRAAYEMAQEKIDELNGR